MTVYCAECGCVIEDGADFCYRCGALRSHAFDMDEHGNLKPLDDGATLVCPRCGYANTFRDNVCADCGALLPSLVVRKAPRRLTTEDYIKLFIGVVVGALGICGLGQILYRRYTRGLMFLALSAVILYVLLSVGYSTSIRYFMLRFLGLLIFFRSSFDLLRIAYYEDPPSDKKGGE